MGPGLYHEKCIYYYGRDIIAGKKLKLKILFIEFQIPIQVLESNST